MVFASLLLAAVGSLAAGLGADDIRHVDGVTVDPKSGLVTLLLVIDRPLEDGLTKSRAKRKLSAYAVWVRSAEFAVRFPGAKPGSAVSVIIAHPPKRSMLGAVVLEQLAGHCQDLKLAAVLKEIQ